MKERYNTNDLTPKRFRADEDQEHYKSIDSHAKLPGIER
jgi:hypothetical protein